LLDLATRRATADIGSGLSRCGKAYGGRQKNETRGDHSNEVPILLQPQRKPGVVNQDRFRACHVASGLQLS
jgi:hypothetical protein